MSEELAVQAEQIAPLPSNIFTNTEDFNQAVRMAQALSRTSIIPQNYQGKVEDCLVAIDMANRMRISPMMVMQNLYVVKGKPSWSGQACISLIQACGKFKDVHHVYTGEKGTDNRGCYVEAVRISDGSIVQGVEVTMTMAKNEGWTSNTKWKNMPELMLSYRAGSFFARVHCPESLMGVQLTEEVIDISKEKRTAEDVLL